MREEVSNWWKQAKRDFQTAKNCRTSGDFYAAVFFCQQAVEKGMKALYMLRKETSPGPTHSLLFLAREVDIPKDFLLFVKELTPEFVITRYPDVVGETPYELYDDTIAEGFIGETEVLLQWLEDQMSRP
jgi:HEPN domain-containing protein